MAKVFAYGFIFNGDDSYLRDPWNILEMFIMIVYVTTVAYPGRLPLLKVLRILRAFVPLKIT